MILTVYLFILLRK